MECGCRAFRPVTHNCETNQCPSMGHSINPSEYQIEYCPLHKAAPQMLGALQDLTECVRSGFIPNEHSNDDAAFVAGWNEAEAALRESFAMGEAMRVIALADPTVKGS